MGLYLETRFIGTLLLRTHRYEPAWQLVRPFALPFRLTAFQALRIEHMLLHQTDPKLVPATLQGQGQYERNVQEGVFQLANLDWDSAHRLAMELNRDSLDHSISPMHYFESACACILESSHFVSLDPKARAAARMSGLKLLPERLSF